NATGILVAQLLGNNSSDVAVGGTLADAFWLSIFPCLGWGTAVLIRHRSTDEDWAPFVDTAIITTGFALLAWVFIIRPAATDQSLRLISRISAIAYPVGDLVILAMMVRLVLGGGSRNMAFRLMV